MRQLSIYDNLESACGLIESFDVADGSQLGFTVGGRVVGLLPPSDLFADTQLTEEVDLERLRSLLLQARGPAYLADDPVAYARGWRRSDYHESHHPPFMPQRCDLGTAHGSAPRRAEIHASADYERRVPVQYLDKRGARGARGLPGGT